ncbi:hypothetical protein [Aliidiomarina quisquiliarum]|uniref:hypothetical protein n=1 Tax=Aliidiomarina quisquiliarum TaxID=2938947 RepID=UPI00208EB35A|nr:hypothetical protein [Aliidiomarina quisquiliarum]MCO4320063.1 hypothetical protein [Aliidiomarina quisquiliarum]
MRKKIRNLAGVCLISPLLLLTACNNDAAKSNASQAQAEVVAEPLFTAPLPAAEGLAGLLSDIRATAGVAYAQNLSSCKLAEVGVKACGGPERYIIYSTEVADEQALLELISRYNEASAAFNRDSQLMSDCSIAPRPRIILNNGICVPQATSLQ